MNTIILFNFINQTIEEKNFFLETLYNQNHFETHIEIETFVGEAKYVHLVVSKQKDAGLYLEK